MPSIVTEEERESFPAFILEGGRGFMEKLTEKTFGVKTRR